MGTLHMFVGNDGSGRKEKAEVFARKHDFILISSDEIWEEMMTEAKTESEKLSITSTIVYEKMSRIAKKLLAKGESVVYDGTNLSKKHRKNNISQARATSAVCHYVADDLEACILRDSESENPKGKDEIIKKFMTTEIPFQDEEFDFVTYDVTPLSDEEFLRIEKNATKIISGRSNAVYWASLFMEAGKPIVETRPDDERKIGYNNMSAQFAFRHLYSPEADLSDIQEIVNLILYKKRFLSSRGSKGEQTIKNQLSEDTYKKLLVLTES